MDELVATDKPAEQSAEVRPHSAEELKADKPPDRTRAEGPKEKRLVGPAEADDNKRPYVGIGADMTLPVLDIIERLVWRGEAVGIFQSSP